MRIFIVSSLAIAGALLPAATARAQSGGASINKVQERQIFDETTRTHTDRDAGMTSTFAKQCTSVLGLAAYCGCLGNGISAGVGFDNFVVVLTRSKQENGYEQLDATSRRAYDAIPALRDKCAAQAKAP